MTRVPLLLTALLAALAIAASPAAAAGTSVSVDGTLSIVHKDPLPGAPLGSDAYRYYLATGGEHLLLRFADAPAYAPDQRIHVEGARTGDTVDVRSSRALQGAPPSVAADGDDAAAVAGTSSVLVLLVTSGVPDSVTPAAAQQLVGSRDSAWYQETSYGAFKLTAKASPWLKIPVQAASCPIYDYLTAADTAARAKGLNPDSYAHVMVYIAQGAQGCNSAAGWGQVSGRITWIMPGYMDERVTLHEIGHNVGLWHSHSIECFEGSTRVPLSLTCNPFNEYGDFWDTMGAGFLGTGHFNAQQKEYLGWMAGRTVDIPAPVAAPRTVTLAPYETTGGTKALVVRTPDRPFWFEYRRPQGNDAFLSAWPEATNGVLVHVPEPGNGTHLLDMTPVTGDGTDGAALPVGQSYTDPSKSFRVTVNSATASGASVTVAPVASGAVNGYVWADRPTTASYVPSTTQQANSSGATNTVARSAKGVYTVSFPGLGVSGGTVDVTAHGAGTEQCVAGTWSAAGTVEKVEVRCFTAAGAPVDSRFLAVFSKPVAAPGLKAAHVWANQPSTASYAPSAAHSFNSTGAANAITRTSVGTYDVRLRGLGASAGTVHVTAQGTLPRTCQVASWRPSGADQIVNVRCFNNTSRTDTPFTLTFTNGVGLLGIPGKPSAYALMGQASVPTFTPQPAYTLNTAGGVNTLTRSAVGTYQVRMTRVGATRGTVQVAGFGSDGNRCKVVSYGRSGVDQLVNVRCTNPAGALADTRFLVNWTA